MHRSISALPDWKAGLLALVTLCIPGEIHSLTQQWSGVDSEFALLSPDGRWIALPTEKCVLIIDAHTRKVRFGFAAIYREGGYAGPGTDFTRGVLPISFSADGQYLNVGSRSDMTPGRHRPKALVVDCARKQFLLLPCRSDTIVATSPGGKYVVTVDLMRRVQLWDLASQRRISELSTRGVPSSAGFLPNGDLYVMEDAGNSDKMELFKAKSLKSFAMFPRKEIGWQGPFFSPDSKFFVECGLGTLSLFRTENGKKIATVRKPNIGFYWVKSALIATWEGGKAKIDKDTGGIVEELNLSSPDGEISYVTSKTAFRDWLSKRPLGRLYQEANNFLGSGSKAIIRVPIE